MELAELLESEGLDPDELMAWARGRADTLVAALTHQPEAAPLLELLEADASVDVSALSEVTPELANIAVEVVREPSSSQPISADELPPPPEQPCLAEGEPEPLLETFDTGPAELGSPEADAPIAASSTLDDDEGDEDEDEFEVSLGELEAEAEAEAESAAELASAVEAAPALEEPAANEEPEPGLAVVEDSAAAEDELEEIEFDEFLELDDGELEMIVEEVVESALPAPPPPPPPSSGPLPRADDVPVRSGDTVTDLPTPAIESEPSEEIPVQTGGTASFPIVEDAPVRTGDTAAHPTVAASEETDGPDDFDLDFDD